MATRLYLSGTAAAINLAGAVSGGGIWEIVTSNVGATKKLTTAHGSTAVTSIALALTNGGVAASNQDYMYWQGLTDPLAAQTLSGNFMGTCCCRENSSLNTDAFVQCGVFVVDPSGARVATLVAGQTSGGTEYNNPSANNRMFPRNYSTGTGPAISGYTCSAGDRIAVEIGTRVTAARNGDTVTMVLGDNGGTDLPTGDGASNSLTASPWVEFSSSLVFATVYPRRTRAFFMGASA